nr:reverse transcriptase domain-containing protein [Tanacetum cinerariifolium]
MRPSFIAEPTTRSFMFKQIISPNQTINIRLTILARLGLQELIDEFSVDFDGDELLYDVVDRSSSKLSRDQTSNPTSSTNPTPKGRICRSSKQKFENSNFEEHIPPVAMMTDNRTMAEMLRAPTEGCAEAIVVPPILGAVRRWFEKEPSHSITNWDDLVSKFINEFFPPSRTINLRNEISNF